MVSDQCSVVKNTQNTLGGSVVSYEGGLVVLCEIQLTLVFMWVELRNYHSRLVRA